MWRTVSLVALVFCLLSCKTDFERIRSSTDPAKIYQAANQYFKDGKWYNAQTLYEQIIPFYRGKAEAEDLFYNYAYTHYNMGDFILSSHYFRSFATSFYNSPRKEECEFMSAYSNYKMSPSHKLDQSFSQKAIDGFQNFVNLYPESERAPECNDLIDELRAKMERKAFDQGMLYFDLKQYASSIHSFRTMLSNFPASKKAEEVRYLIIKAGYQYADNSIFTKKSERFDEVISDIKTFQKKYPSSKYKKEMKQLKEDSNLKYIKYKS